METLLIQVNSLSAYKLIEDLENLDIIKVLKKTSDTNSPTLSSKYRGVFSEADAKSFNEHTQNMRGEWNNI